MMRLDAQVRAAVEASVLCWLATVDARGWPSVSPKEIFTILDEEALLIAHIASPRSVANIRAHPEVCVSFVDVFVQKGFKVRGRARLVSPADADWEAVSGPLAALAGPDYPLRAVIVVSPETVEPIVAPSWWLFPERTEAERVAAAMATYGVRPAQP